MNSVKKNICFAASSGGHFEQLMMLRPLMEKYDSFILTEKTKYSVAGTNANMRYLRQVNRKEWNWIFAMAYNIVKSFFIYLKEKPDLIVCTGALAMLPMCMICKLFKKKLIFIESFAKVTSPTQTGKFLYKYADEFYVQWKPMLKVYPKAKYLGGIY